MFSIEICFLLDNETKVLGLEDFFFLFFRKKYNMSGLAVSFRPPSNTGSDSD